MNVTTDHKAKLQQQLRAAIAIAYELKRHEQIQHRAWIASTLGELEATLMRVEAKLGGPLAGQVSPADLGGPLERLAEMTRDAGPVVDKQLEALVASVRAIQGNLHDAPVAAE